MIRTVVRLCRDYLFRIDIAKWVYFDHVLSVPFGYKSLSGRETGRENRYPLFAGFAILRLNGCLRPIQTWRACLTSARCCSLGRMVFFLCDKPARCRTRHTDQRCTLTPNSSFSALANSHPASCLPACAPVGTTNPYKASSLPLVERPGGRCASRDPVSRLSLTMSFTNLMDT
jgi:hypothetical protein